MGVVYIHALVAQLDRVSDYESEGQGFESLQARQRFVAKAVSRSQVSGGAFCFLRRLTLRQI